MPEAESRHRINVYISHAAYERLHKLARQEKNLGLTIEKLIMDVTLPTEPSENFRALEASRIYVAVLPLQFMRI